LNFIDDGTRKIGVHPTCSAVRWQLIAAYLAAFTNNAGRIDQRQSQISPLFAKKNGAPKDAIFSG
jgi:hypothetical protein